MKIYLVGGALRDELLKLAITDRDWVVVGSTPEAMLHQGFLPIGKDFPVFLHPKTHEEYALARSERKTAPGYHGFIFHANPSVTLKEDLQRRDLTINAMARGEDGWLIDPFHGQQDLEHRLLRHVSAAFVEDPVRLLRVARLLAKLAPFDFVTAPETIQLLKHMVNQGEVDALVPERVQQELDKGMNTANPARMFQALRDWGALERLFPQCPWQHFTLSLQALEVSAQTGLPLPSRWCAWIATLLHDQPDNQHLISAWSARYHWSQEKQRRLTLACDLGPVMRQLSPAQPEAWLPLLEQYDAWRRPQRFLQALDLQACLSPIFPHSQLDLATRGRQALNVCLNLDSAAIARSTPHPRDIPAQLQAQRRAALSTLTPTLLLDDRPLSRQPKPPSPS